MSKNTMTDVRAGGPQGRVGSAEVPMRPMEFDAWVADMPKHFAADGDIMMSHILTVLSSTFPDGEDFFVRSVEAFRDQITDPQLRTEVDGFIGQEEMHGREHRVLNDHLAKFGYPTGAISKYVQGLFWVRERIQTKKVNLAFTAALEHYTATLAETLLGDAEARDAVGHPGARAILTWHALEEAEHKAVAFDVYRAVGGSERTRTIVMWLTHYLFLVETSIWVAVSIAMDNDARRHPLKLARSLARLPNSPFASPRAVRQLLQYHRRGFHPNDRDTKQLVAEWRETLFGSDGELVEALAG